MTVSFRSLTYADLPRLTGWIGAPHVQRWWNEPADLRWVAVNYGPCIDGTDPTDQFIVVLDGRDIGFIQSYRHRDYPAWDREVGIANAAGLDYFIGDPLLTRRGIGAAMIGAFVPGVFERYPDVDVIVVTPQHANRASCRILEKSGFALTRVAHLRSDEPGDIGPAAVHVLRR